MKKCFSIFSLLSIFLVSSVYALDYVSQTIQVRKGFAGSYNVSLPNQSIVLAGSAEVADVINDLVATAKAKNDERTLFKCDVKAHEVVYNTPSVRFFIYKFTQIFEIKNCIVE